MKVPEANQHRIWVIYTRYMFITKPLNDKDRGFDKEE